MTDSSVEMKRFGRTLTDRADGKKAFQDILSQKKNPTMLDFRGVMALGSSFGDEVVTPLARLNQNHIRVMNTNAAIRECLSKIVEDSNITIEII